MMSLADFRPGLNATARIVTGAARDRTGVATLDYALIAGLIALGAVAGVQVLGDAVTAMYDTVSAAFVAALSP